MRRAPRRAQCVLVSNYYVHHARVPASTPTGETFEYEELGKWILMRGTYPTNPSAKLSVTELHPNLYLRSEIEKWLDARGVNVS